jgi:hypothetical protein
MIDAGSGFWGAKLEPSESFSVSPPVGWVIRLSSAAFALSAKLGDKPEAALVIDDSGSSYCLCRLGYHTLSTPLDLFFVAGTNYTLKNIGNTAVDITGYKTPADDGNESDFEEDDEHDEILGSAFLPSIGAELEEDDGSESDLERPPTLIPSSATVEEITSDQENKEQVEGQPPSGAGSGKGKKQKRQGDSGAQATKKAKVDESKQPDINPKSKPQGKPAASKPAAKPAGKPAGKAAGAKGVKAVAGAGTIKCSAAGCDKTFANEKARDQHAAAKHKSASASASVAPANTVD